MSDNALRIVRVFRSRKGSITFAFLLLASLSMLGTPFVMTGLSEGRLQTRSTGSVIALAAAEAGLARALWIYNYNEGLFGDNGWPVTECPLGSSIWCASRISPDHLTFTDANSTPLSTANVTITNLRFLPTSNNGRATVTSIGQMNTSNVSTQLTVQLSSNGGDPGAQEPLRAKAQIRLNQGVLVDSYNSALGVYGAGLSASPHAIYGSLNKSQNGVPATYRASIHTASTETWNPSQAVYLEQTTTVYGKASIGTGGTSSAFRLPPGETNIGNFIKGDQDGVIWGTDTTTLTTVPNRTVSYGSTNYTSCASGQIIDLTVSSSVDSIVLPAGAGGCTIRITGNGTLRVRTLNMPGINNRVVLNGNVNLLVATAFTMGDAAMIEVPPNKDTSIQMNATNSQFTLGQNAMVNTSTQKPGSFELQMKGSLEASASDTIVMGNGTTFYGRILAPKSRVDLGQSTHFFGAIEADTIWVGQYSDIHFDEALRGNGCTGCTPLKVSVFSWSRQ